MRILARFVSSPLIRKKLFTAAQSATMSSLASTYGSWFSRLGSQGANRVANIESADDVATAARFTALALKLRRNG